VVTGPKADFWLVQTVGVLVRAIGGGIALALRRPAQSLELRVVAALAAAGLAAVDIYFVSRRRIRPVYLADAAIELLFAPPLLRKSLERVFAPSPVSSTHVPTPDANMQGSCT
jgi:hypothetical protein